MDRDLVGSFDALEPLQVLLLLLLLLQIILVTKRL